MSQSVLVYILYFMLQIWSKLKIQSLALQNHSMKKILYACAVICIITNK